jgi:HD-like signal output (HDOD) protein
VEKNMSELALDSVTRTLMRFEDLSHLDGPELRLLASEVTVREAAPGDCVLPIGSEDRRLLFLVEGGLELTAEDGARHVVRHTDRAAAAPICRLRPSRYQVTARTFCQYILIDEALIERLGQAGIVSNIHVEESGFGLDFDSDEEPMSHPVVFSLLDDINRRTVLLPLQNQLAISVGRALETCGDDGERMSYYIGLCPVLASKVICAAVRRVGRERSIGGLREAVAVLGADRAYALVIRSILSESLRARQRRSRRLVYRWWKQSIRVAAASRAIARISERFDPEYAYLVGLQHALGEGVLLCYADRHGDLRMDAELASAIAKSRAHMGRVLTMLWNLPDDIVAANGAYRNWQHREGDETGYVDIATAALWFALVEAEDDDRPSTAEQLSAFRRLGLDGASDDFLLSVREATARSVYAAKAQLAAFD